MSGKGFGRRALALVMVSVLLLSALAHSIALGAQATRVIVEGVAAGDAAEAVLDRDGVVETDLPIINAVVARIGEEQVMALQADARVLRVTADRTVELTDTKDYRIAGNDRVDVEFSKAVGVQEVWEAGELGKDVTVAILDTGVDPRFLELRRAITGRGDRFLAYYDAIGDRVYRHPHLLQSPGDPNGHGTHVAGIIANNEFERDDGEYRGVAPAANIVAVRVLNSDGVGSYADVLRGIQWVVANRDRYNIRVMNISMYALPVAPYWADPYNLAVMAAWNAGITVVASVGNTGPSPMSVGVPGNTPYVITVGAFTDHRTPDDLGDDYIPEFSAAGPTLDAYVKPDVIAPGAHIVSLMHPTAQIRRSYSDRWVVGRYFEMSGSSMSTAVVSGIAALVLGENAELSPDEVKYRITQTARPQLAAPDGQPTAAYSVWQQGAGRAWAADAVLSALQGSANQGMNLSDDLGGLRHYQGWTTFETETGFRILGGGFDDWIAGYTTWDGEYADWAGGYAGWAGGDTNWSGSFDSWADSFDSWADSFDSWADSFDSWADNFDSWADSYDDWAGDCAVDQTSFDSWADSFDSWADSFDSWADFEFWVESFDSWADFIDAVAGTDAAADVDLLANSFDSWADFMAWMDSFDSWADFTAWPDSFDSWADSFDSWADSLGTWADVVAFSSSFDSWADSFDSWADRLDTGAGDTESCGAWVGSFDSWADSYGHWVMGLDSMSDGLAAWTGAFSTWEGGYLTWAVSFDSWADSFDSWADGYGYWVSACSADGASFDSWADSFDSWADTYGEWYQLEAWLHSFGGWEEFVAAVGGTDAAEDVAVLEDSFDSWADFVAWVDSFDSWADFVAWTDSFDSWADSFDSWADSFDSWADFAVWADSFDSWADSFDSWADSAVGSPRPVFCDGWSTSFDSWADSFDSWADSFDSWADGNPTWAGGYTAWAGGPQAWATLDAIDSWAVPYGDPVWAMKFAATTKLISSTPLVSINLWVDAD